ncbi:DUF2812 domain-containing protein [Facklamia sp. P13055]|uniref:DUF2812 domain-containing protein n=1 Tax=unclassified Facklamia TaxID=2622293 RepID=UPI003D162BE0
MKQIIKRKVFLFKDLDKQEAWINSFRKEGYRFINKKFPACFVFEKIDDKVPITRIDYREFEKSSEYQNYIQLFSDMGWTVVSSRKNFSVHYFQQNNPNSEDFIYSNKESYAEIYKRYSQQALNWSIIFLFFFTIFSTGDISYSLFNPRTAFLTPGLWEMTGWQFWSSFIFEIPFALMRLLSKVIWLILAAWMGFEAFVNKRKYNDLIHNSN